MTQKGLMNSNKGPKRWVRLARSPQEITVFQVLEAIDGLTVSQKCIVGKLTCTKSNLCTLHDIGSRIRDEKIYDMLVDISIAQLIEQK